MRNLSRIRITSTIVSCLILATLSLSIPTGLAATQNEGPPSRTLIDYYGSRLATIEAKLAANAQNPCTDQTLLGKLYQELANAKLAYRGTVASFEVLQANYNSGGNSLAFAHAVIIGNDIIQAYSNDPNQWLR